MTLRPALVTAALLLMTGTAFAEALLRAEVTVTAPIVTVGDMFEDAGIHAEKALFRAPRPGTTGTVTLEAIETAAERAGLSDYTSRGLAAVSVSRAATVIDETALSALIDADLSARGILGAGISTRITFPADFEPVDAAAVETPVSLDSLRYLPGSGAFNARFSIAGFDAPLQLNGTIDLMIEVPHLTAALPAGTVLGANDLELRQVPLRYAESVGYVAIENLVGMALQRQSREGMMLKESDVAAPELIARNEMVTIYYRSGPMTLTVKGQALNGAAQGESVQVLNLMSKRVIATTAAAPGAVTISTSPLSVAGL